MKQTTLSISFDITIILNNYNIMNHRTAPKKAGHGTGQVSLRTEGYIVQSIRMNVDDNNDVRMAADKAGMSINSWVVATLREAATAALKKKRTTKNGKASS